MKVFFRYPLLLAAFALVFSGCGKSGPVITDDQVVVQTDKLVVTFDTARSFSNSYMVFGGATLNQSAAFFNVSLAGLEVGTARSIYSRYPDFDRCSSPGAPLAQQSINQLDIVPANAGVTKTLKKALSLNEKQTAGVSENVCVTLIGRVLLLRSAVLRDLDEDITAQLPAQVHHEYFLVESAEISKFQDILTASMQ